MKQVIASEARKHWSRLLDDALRGEVIAVERKGQRVVIRKEEPAQFKGVAVSTRYKKLLTVSNTDEADRWSWKWRPEHRLELRQRSTK
jgi:antitoxin (DNA-binding transcriptional repressor) of toxin-antitoxin stability system